MSKRTGVMLAKPLTPSLLSKMPDWVIVQAKLDGDRCRAVPSLATHSYDLYSSQGTLRNFAVPHIDLALAELATALHGSNAEHWRTFDGELYIHGVSHQQLRAAVSRTAIRHEDFDSIQYHVFDIIDNRMQLLRTGWLMEAQKFVDARGGSFPIRIVPTFKVPNEESEIAGALRVFLSDGYEGVIVRDPYAYYEPKRSSHLLKLKPDLHASAPAIEFLEACSLEGTLKGMLGAFLVTADLGFGMRTFKVGAGKLTHAERIALWQHSPPPACIVHFRYLTLTDDGLPREPVCTHVEIMES